MRRSKRGTGFLVLGVLLLLAALALTAYNQWDSDRAEKAAMEVLDDLEQVLPRRTALSILDMEAYQIQGGQSETVPEMPTLELDGERYIGVIAIPSEGVELPVLAQWDYDKLTIAPGHYYGSYYTADLVIAGHNYSSQLGVLKRIALNTDVYFTNAEGVVFHYIVDNVESLQPTQVEEMLTGDWDMTLFTCNKGGQTRRAIRCVLVLD